MTVDEKVRMVWWSCGRCEVRWRAEVSDDGPCWCCDRDDQTAQTHRPRRIRG